MSRVPQPPLDGLIDDLYYLEGASPYPKLLVPPMPSALLFITLDGPFRLHNGDPLWGRFADEVRERMYAAASPHDIRPGGRDRRTPGAGAARRRSTAVPGATGPTCVSASSKPCRHRG